MMLKTKTSQKYRGRQPTINPKTTQNWLKTLRNLPCKRTSRIRGQALLTCGCKLRRCKRTKNMVLSTRRLMMGVSLEGPAMNCYSSSLANNTSSNHNLLFTSSSVSNICSGNNTISNTSTSFLLMKRGGYLSIISLSAGPFFLTCSHHNGLEPPNFYKDNLASLHTRSPRLFEARGPRWVVVFRKSETCNAFFNYIEHLKE
mmetsp:Transcript_23139/g.67083  ORF Transcript_23139/g.67083 Transcript_23139/m.67083 type:complete len:201 (+) Transcript_23139:385-987(+)